MSKNEFQEKTGMLIRDRRVALGLTQEELAAAVGVSRASISSWELGEKAIPAYTLREIRRHFRRKAGQRDGKVRA